MNEVTRLTKAWGRALDANVRYTALLSELAVRSFDLLVSAVSEIGPQIISTDITQEASSVTPTPPAPVLVPPPPAMVLEGEAGARAFGLFVVENKLAKEVTTQVAVGPLIDPDGQEIPSVLRFEPGIITLAPGEQVVAKVSAKISRGLVSGVRYLGEISIPGISGASIPIIVRRKPTTRTSDGVVKPNTGNTAAGAPKPRNSGQRSLRKSQS